MAEEKKTTTKAEPKKAAPKKTTTAKTTAAKPAAKKAAPKVKLDLNAAIKAASKKKAEPQEKKSLDEIIKHDNEEHKSDKPLDHNEVLRKKMEAQKKLNEDFEAKEKSNDIRAKLQALTSNEDIDTKEYEPIEMESNDQVKELEEQIEKLNNEVKDRDEQIMVLTNSIVSKTNEAELLKEIEQLKLEISNLKEQKAAPEEAAPEVNKVDIESEEIKAIINQGDILLRIKLLNERISEKDAQIKLVEDELNNLKEEDIVATAFATRVKIIRDDRRNIVDITNKKLVDLSKGIKSEEYRLNQKIVERNQKQAEIEAFNKDYENQRYTYLEREEALSKRSKMQTELDGLNVSVDRIQEEFAHQVMIYKKIIKEAENFVESCNEQEDNLIQLYLKELRAEKSAEKPDYESSIVERDNMLAELDKLNKIYDEMKAKNMLTDDEPVASVDEINQMKKEYAKLVGKLQMIASRYQERTEVEDVLRTVDPEVSTYLNAFSEKEKLAFDNQEKMDIIASTTPEMRDKLNKIIEANRARIAELDNIVKQYEASEKVVFYKQLLNSMAELKEKEAIIKEKAQKLKLEIERKDFSEE